MTNDEFYGDYPSGIEDAYMQIRERQNKEKQNKECRQVLEAIKEEIEAARYGLINDGLDVAVRIIDKHCPSCGAKMVEPQESEEISERNMKMWEEIFKAERSDKE